MVIMLQIPDRRNNGLNSMWIVVESAQSELGCRILLSIWISHQIWWHYCPQLKIHHGNIWVETQCKHWIQWSKLHRICKILVGSYMIRAIIIHLHMLLNDWNRNFGCMHQETVRLFTYKSITEACQCCDNIQILISATSCSQSVC